MQRVGLTIWKLGRPAEAEEIFRRALRIKPDDFRLLSNLGVTLYEQDRFDEAGEFCRAAIQYQPDAFDAHMNIGVMLSEQGKFDEAMGWLDRAQQLNSQAPDIFLDQGMNLFRQGKTDEAIGKYEQGLTLRPGFPRLRRNLAYALLCRGDYERGWQEHEWRMKCHDYPGLRVNRPFWNGENFLGKTILLHHEQGFGDTLQMIRYAPLVRARGRDVLVWCPRKLLRLVARCEGVAIAFDGSVFSPDSPASRHCIACRPFSARRCRPSPRGCLISSTIPCWSTTGVRSRPGDRRRRGESLTILVAAGRAAVPDWHRLAGQPDSSHRSLAIVPVGSIRPNGRAAGCPADQLAVRARPRSARSPDRPAAGHGANRARVGDFAETAAIMSHLDLVITPDTAVAHLAGGLGVPVWVALCSVGEWRLARRPRRHAVVSHDEAVPPKPSRRLGRRVPADDGGPGGKDEGGGFSWQACGMDWLNAMRRPGTLWNA